MGIEQGLLQGLAEGIKGGMESYRTERSYQDAKREKEEEKAYRKKLEDEEKMRQRKQFSLSLLGAGAEETPEGGIVKSQAALDKEALARAETEGKLREKGLLLTKADGAYKIEKDPTYKPLADELTKSQIAENYAKVKKESNIAKVEKEPKPTQFVAAGFAKRLQQAEDAFGKLADRGFDPTSNKASIQRLGMFPEMLKSEDAKLQDQAERNFVNATLRRESGAAISPKEFESAEKQYFPRVGDTPEVVAQKAENRKSVAAAMLAEGGPATGKVESAFASLPSQKVRKQDGGLIPSAQAAPMPKAGEVQQGYRYKGGDPSKPESWEKI